MTIETNCNHTLQGQVEPFPMVTVLTRCCGAAATGSGQHVVCKGCWMPVNQVYGQCAEDAHQATQMMESLGCPVPTDCGIDAWVSLIEEVQVD